MGGLAGNRSPARVRKVAHAASQGIPAQVVGLGLGQPRISPDIPGYLRISQDISGYLRISQDISGYAQDISGYLRICPH